MSIFEARSFDVGRFETDSLMVDKNLTAWNRLEVRPRKVKFSRSLRAEVRDPLWMLCRQWQWGEFKGEDTGTAVLAKIHKVTRQATRLSLGGQPAVTYAATMDNVPLEARVEQTPIPMDTAMGMKIGQRWKRILAKKSLDVDHYWDEYMSEYPFTIPANSTHDEQMLGAAFFSDQDNYQAYIAVQNRTIDGRLLLAYIAGGGDASDNITLKSGTTGNDTVLNTAGEELKTWFDTLYQQPSTTNPAWIERRMEYQAAASIPQEEPGSATPTAPTVVQAKEHYHGQLDWYSFDIAANGTAHASLFYNTTTAETDTISEEKTTIIPSGIHFPGMPADRWWELEDGRVNLSSLEVNSTDIAKVMMAEFGLVYAHEWNIVPYKVPVGSLNEIKSIVATDTFGVKTLIEAAGKGADSNWQRWNMFNLNHNTNGPLADNRLFIPPALMKTQEGTPIEKVHFIRDEMSNMVWGIEAIIPDNLGGGRSGYQAAREQAQYFENLADPIDPELMEDNLAPMEGVNIRYKLMSTVPENWIPFVPVHLGGTSRAVQLQRATMPRLTARLELENASPFYDYRFVRPKSLLLNPTGASWSLPIKYVYEEEVPRAGVHVSTNYQRARWYNGTTMLWLGRRKQTGHGEGSSGLLYDKLHATIKGED